MARDGYTVKRIRFFEDFDELEHKHRRMMAAEAAQEHVRWYAQYTGRYSQHMHQIMETGRSVDAAELAQSRLERLALRGAIEQTLVQQGADLWIAPAATGPAPAGIESTGDPIMNLPWTNAGVPALTLPAGMQNGLPLGLQLIAPFGQDERLVAWAAVVEDALHEYRS